MWSFFFIIVMNKRVRNVVGREHKIDISNFHSFTFSCLRFFYRIKYKVRSFYVDNVDYFREKYMVGKIESML